MQLRHLHGVTLDDRGTGRPILLLHGRAEHDLTDVTVVGSSIGGWMAAEMLTDPRSAERVNSAVLLDAVGILVPEHSIADISAMPIDHIADLSYHDPDRYRIDPAAIPAERRVTMAATRDVVWEWADRLPGRHDITRSRGRA